MRGKLFASILGLAAALPAAAAEDGPRITHEQRFGAWALSCAVAQDAKGVASERCWVAQIVTTSPTKGRVVLGITADYADSATVPTLRFRFSANAHRQTGIGIKVGSGAPMRLAITDCNPERCEAVGRLSPELRKAWQQGAQGKFAYRLRSGKQITAPISTDGLDAALTALASRLAANK